MTRIDTTGTGKDMVRDKVRDKVGRVPWNAQFRRWKTRCFEITARRDRQSSCALERAPSDLERM
jgi:hypothetical protein